MGSCHSQKNLVVLPLQNTILSRIFIILLLISAANSAKSSKKRQKCDVDRCGQYFRSVRDMTNDIDKCRQLSSHRDCLTSMSDVCRGNLLYHTSVHVNEKKLKGMNCAVILTSPPPESGSSTPDSDRTNQCIYAGKPKFKLCSLFGDPHVRTFSDKCHTCKANGSWPLISNDYLVVKATNSLLKGQLQATAISKLVVTIKGSGECAKHRTYLAEIGSDLPSTFTDGSTHTGLKRSVNVSVKEQGKEIQIDIRFIATTILIRNVGSHLTFSVQMPEEIVDSPVDRRHQMCVRGCPKRQRIRLKQEINRLNVKDPEKKFTRIYTEPEARQRCKNVLLGLEEEEKAVQNGREKRDAGKNALNEHKRREVELDASAQSWWQLSHSSHGGRSRSSSPRQKKSKNRHRAASERKRFEFLKDDPAPGRRDRNRAAVSSVGRGTNFYFEACVFDLMTTGDVTYASSARVAFDDVTRFHRFGKKAKGASRKAINNYPIISTTSPPFKPTRYPQNTTLRSRDVGHTTSGSHPISMNITLLIFCLLSTTYFLNLLNFQLIFGHYNVFSKRRGSTT